MSIDSLKNKVGTKIATVVDVFIHQCKYTTQAWIAKGVGTYQTAITDSVTVNQDITVTGSGFDATAYDDPFVYARFGGTYDTALQRYAGGELIKCEVVSQFVIKTVARAQFGTTASAHTSTGQPVILVHVGEADGTCYSTTFNCSSANNYDEDSEIKFRFCTAGTALPHGEPYYNGLIDTSLSHSAPKVDPSVSMGKRAGYSFSVKDSIDGDLYVTYPDRRTQSGTLFTKLMARNPYFELRRMEVYSGLYEKVIDLNNFIKREYIIDDFQLSGGIAKFTGLDPLILTEDKKAKAPLTGLGRIAVGNALTDASTKITYDNDAPLAYGAIGETGFVRIESEEISYTVLSDFELTINFRAEGGTEKKDHKEGATIQKVLVYDNVHFVDILTDLFQLAKIPARFIDDYSQVKTDTPTLTYTRHITKPLEIKKLVDEIIYISDITVFYDEELAKIRIRKTSDINLQPVSLNEDDHIGSSGVKIRRLPDEQFTRAPNYWAQTDVTKESGEEYYTVAFNTIALSTEQPYNKGAPNENKVFFNNWLTSSPDDFIKGAAVAQRQIDRSKELPYEYEFDLDVENIGNTQGGEVDLGSVLNITTSKRCNPDGSPLSENFQITSIRDMQKMLYRLTCVRYQEPISGTNIDFSITENKENYDLSTEFAPTEAGNYVIYIETGVVIGGTQGNIAFTTGAQNAGVTFDLIVRGVIGGHGGNGGGGGFSIVPSHSDFPSYRQVLGQVGQVGGTAFNATVNCTINAGSGLIFGGGGGAAGGKSVSSSLSTTEFAIAGNGGSGGQGYSFSEGGFSGTAIVDGTPIYDEGQDGIGGNYSSAGSLAGISGGKIGENGDSHDGVAGGLVGIAIKKNGNNVTITSGSIGGSIKGRIV